MKNTFYYHFKPTQEEISNIWERAIFAIDTNILLNLYRYSKQTREKFIEALKTIDDRLWLPNYVGIEFFRNRTKTSQDQAASYSKLNDSISDIVTKLKNNNRHPFLDKELFLEFEKISGKVIDYLSKSQTEISDSLINDQLLLQISQLFDEKVGKPFSDERVIEICKEGEVRYTKKIPPGFKDSSKNSTDRASPYGDLIIWYELIEKSISEQKPIILISDDQKEDWWLKVDGKHIGLLPDLTREFQEKTGNRILIYTSERFVKFLDKSNGRANNDQVLSELKIVGSQEQEIIKEEKNTTIERTTWSVGLSGNSLNIYGQSVNPFKGRFHIIGESNNSFYFIYVIFNKEILKSEKSSSKDSCIQTANRMKNIAVFDSQIMRVDNVTGYTFSIIDYNKFIIANSKTYTSIGERESDINLLKSNIFLSDIVY